MTISKSINNIVSIVFARYCDLLHHLKLASQDLAAKVSRKSDEIEIPTKFLHLHLSRDQALQMIREGHYHIITSAVWDPHSGCCIVL